MMYRISLPDVTRTKNINSLILNTPATTVSGSPITGTHAKKRLYTPYVLNRCLALSNSLSEILKIDESKLMKRITDETPTIIGICSKCGCTDDDCRQCIEKTGEPCHWVNEEHSLCSACVEIIDRELR